MYTNYSETCVWPMASAVLSSLYPTSHHQIFHTMSSHDVTQESNNNNNIYYPNIAKTLWCH